jgi:phospholipid/cholesterol/gamma-HCH transport system substrate-binding protein
VTRAIRKHAGDFAALAVLTVIAIGVAAYIISQQEARGTFPFIEKKPFELKAEFSDAQAVIPGQGQTVRVAGVRVGKIGKVDIENGVAVVTMNLERKKVEDGDLVVRSDATALLRPRTGLKDMFIELDPGGTGRKLEEKDTIPVQNTEPDVDPDEVLSALDADTRQYLQLLLNGAGKGLKDRGNDLNQVLKRLEPTNRDLNRLTSAVAARRRNLSRLVHNYGSLLEELSGKDTELKRLVNASNATLSAFAQEEQNISLAVSRLPGTLRTTADTLGRVERFGRVLGPALESLRPPFRQLAVANREVLPFVREAEPIVRTEIRPFVRAARPFTRDLRPAAVNLSRAAPDLATSFHQLNRFFNIAAYNPNGREPVGDTLEEQKAREEGYLFWLGWTAHNTVSLFSTSDAQGPFRRANFGVNCTTLRSLLSQNPAAGPLVGVTNILNAPGLCPDPTAPGAPRRRGELEERSPLLPPGVDGGETRRKPDDAREGEAQERKPRAQAGGEGGS